MIIAGKRPGARTPTSGVVIEMLYLCAVGLSAGIAAWATGASSPSPRAPSSKRNSQPPRHESK